MMFFNFDTGRSVVSDRPMFEFIGDKYEESRYLQSANHHELERRLIGLIGMIIRFKDDGSPQFELRNDASAIAFGELLREYRLRNVDSEALIVTNLMPFAGMFSAENVERIRNILEPLRGRKCLFKFVPSRYSASILAGEIRFQTAEFYNSSSLNPTINDDELAIEHRLKNLQIITASGDVIPAIDDRTVARASGDYFISSFTNLFKLQHFHLLERDVCVVIPDGDAFARDVEAAYRAKYSEDEFVFSQVEYIDRFRSFKGKAPIELRKSWNYAFQNEWRFASWNLDADPITSQVRTVAIDPTRFGLFRIVQDDPAHA